MKALRSEGFVTLSDYITYTRFHLLKGKLYRFKVAALLFLLVFVVAALVIAGFLSGNQKLWILAGAIVLCVVIFFYTVNVNVKNTCKQNASTVRAKQVTVFGKNGFVVDLIFHDEAQNENYEILYDEIEKVYLAPKAIYIYIEKRSAIVIPKRNLKISPSDARRFLEKYIQPEKLVVCV